MLGDIIPLDILSSIWSQCNSCDGGCSAGGITLFSVAIHECWVKLWSLHRVRASLTTAVLSQMQSPYMKRLCTACYRWYTLRIYYTWMVWVTARCPLCSDCKNFFPLPGDHISSSDVKESHCTDHYLIVSTTFSILNLHVDHLIL